MSASWVQPELVRPALQEALAGFGDDHPWERALTMQGLVSASGALSEALQWGRDSVALFRSVGDQMYAANTLFIMAQRVDLRRRRAMTRCTGGSPRAGHWPRQPAATATCFMQRLASAQLAWLRGDHDGAAELMAECLPTLRRLGDRRCAGRALFILGERAHETGQLARADELLQASVEAVALAGQSFVLVRALEALAAVRLAQGRPRSAAMLLGTAHTERQSASEHKRPLPPPEENLHRTLVQNLGAAAFDAAHREGKQLSPAEALRFAQLDGPDDSLPART